MSPKEERQNRQIGWMVSIGIHAVLLLLFFLVMAWREPDPPVPEYGIELNFGLDAAGAGEVQPEEAASRPEEVDTEETDTEESPLEEEQTPPESLIEEEVTEEAVDPVETQDAPSPDVAEPPVQVEDSDPEETDQTTEVSEEARDEPVETPTEDPADGVSETPAEAEESSSQGDQAAETGDQGDPGGSLDSRALYGSQGGGGGPLLDLSGWIWDFEPSPEDTSDENGRIVFEIKIDDRGEIISVRTLEKSVSPEVERIYRQEVEALTFSPISPNTVPAPVSTGKITFIIRSR